MFLKVLGDSEMFLEKKIVDRVVRCSLDFLILQMVAKKTLWGYEIIKEIRRRFGVYVGPSSVYPLIAELEKRGYVETKYSFVGGKPRKELRITEKGREYVKRQMRELESMAVDVDGRLIHVIFQRVT